MNNVILSITYSFGYLQIEILITINLKSTLILVLNNFLQAIVFSFSVRFFALLLIVSILNVEEDVTFELIKHLDRKIDNLRYGCKNNTLVSLGHCFYTFIGFNLIRLFQSCSALSTDCFVFFIPSYRVSFGFIDQRDLSVCFYLPLKL